jgi:nucleoside-diphosphate-sugar epimerase
MHPSVILTDELQARARDERALITGASGFVGGRLREALIAAGADVMAIARPSSPKPKAGRSAVADYADEAALKKVVAEFRPDVVYHVAGATKGVSYEDFQRANVMPTRNLLRALEDEHPDVKRLVMVSSLAAFGPSQPDRPHQEGDEPRPIEHYGKSKLEAESVLAEESNAVKWTVIRPGGVYGPGDGDYFNLFREVDKGRNVYFGNRDRWFSAVYVDDCVRAIVAAADVDDTAGRAYFVCDGVPITWKDFQEAIVRASGRRVMTLNLPEFFVDLAAVAGELATKIDKKPRLFNKQKAKMGAQSAWTCQHDAARRDFAYEPTVALEEGVERALAWYREHGWV